MEASHFDLERFAAAVVSRLGFHVHQQNVDEVGQAMRRCLKRTGCASVSAYVEKFKEDAFAEQEVREIAADLTVPETSFFRHPEHFRVLVDIAVPECIRARRPARSLNLLSAGCATGEEAYSLRAALADIPALANWDVRILGVDVNPQCLQKARDGRYSAWSLRTIPETERGNYFRRTGAIFALEDRLKTGVRFEARNLLDSDSQFWRPGRFDVIFCRNVMIYLSPAAVRQVVDQFATSLAPGGFLFLGPSETLRGITREFRLRHGHNTFYYQRQLADQAVDDASPMPLSNETAGQPASRGHWPPDDVDAGWAAIQGASDRVASFAGRAADLEGNNGVTRPTNDSPPQQESNLRELRDFVRQERFGDALRLLGSASQRDAADPDVLLLEAVARANSGDLPGAESACRQLLARDELRPGAHYLLAFCRERSGDYLSAAEHDSIAIYLDPAFAMAHLHIGLIASRLGDVATARRELTEALSLLATEDPSRILLFGGGFGREALVRFCEAQLARCGSGR